MCFENFLSDRIQCLSRNNFVNDSFRASRKSSQLAPRQHERQCIDQANLPRESNRPPPTGQQPKLHFLESELRFFMRARNSVLAGKCEFQSTSQTGTGNQRDRWNFQIFEALKDALSER